MELQHYRPGRSAGGYVTENLNTTQAVNISVPGLNGIGVNISIRAYRGTLPGSFENRETGHSRRDVTEGTPSVGVPRAAFPGTNLVD